MYKKILINSIIIFVLSSLIHFLYESLPYFITSIFAPVNESIWEHMKLIFSSYMLLLLIKFLFFKKKWNNNNVTAYVIAGLFNIVIFLIIYLPINKIIGKEIMWLTFVLYFISILISNYVLYRIQLKKENKKLNKIMLFSIIFIYIIFTFLTYYPPRLPLFYDKAKQVYGVYKFYS